MNVTFTFHRLLHGSTSRVQASTSESVVSTGSIYGTLVLPSVAIAKLPPINSTLITLNDGEYSTYTTPTIATATETETSPSDLTSATATETAIKQQFSFHNIPPGVHVLDVHHPHYHFSQIKIQLLPENNMEPNCIEYMYPGSTKYSLPHPLTLTAHATFTYYEQRPSFSPFRLFKNPMVLMMIVSVGFMLLMPSMMSNLDPEQKEQMKKQMEMQQDPSKMLSQMWSDLSGAANGNGNQNHGGPGAGNDKVVKKKTSRTRLKRE